MKSRNVVQMRVRYDTDTRKSEIFKIQDMVPLKHVNKIFIL